MKTIPTLMFIAAVFMGPLYAETAPPSGTVESLEKVTAGVIRSRAEVGDAAAQFEYGRRLNYGTDAFQRNEKEARGWLEKSAAQGYADAKLMLVELDIGRIGNDEVMARYRALAEQGIPAAQWRMYTFPGRSTDPDERSEWLKKATAAGYPEALMQTGIMRQFGAPGVNPDSDKALDYYKKAFAAGITRAVPRIAAIYLEKGDGVSAVSWLKKTPGDGESAVLLGDIYSAGLAGVGQDWPRAYAHYVIGSAKGYESQKESAAQKRAVVAELLTEAQKLEAQKILAESGGMRRLTFTAREVSETRSSRGR